MNLAIFTGNLGRDPELRTANGDSVLGFPIGVQSGTKDKPSTLWVSCALWGKRATSLQPYLSKGMRVTVSGPVKLEEYQAKDGSMKSNLRMTVDQIDLPPKTDGHNTQQAPKQGQLGSTGSGFDDMENDPF